MLQKKLQTNTREEAENGENKNVIEILRMKRKLNFDETAMTNWVKQGIVAQGKKIKSNIYYKLKI